MRIAYYILISIIAGLLLVTCRSLHNTAEIPISTYKQEDTTIYHHNTTYNIDTDKIYRTINISCDTIGNITTITDTIIHNHLFFVSHKDTSKKAMIQTYKNKADNTNQNKKGNTSVMKIIISCVFLAAYAIICIIVAFGFVRKK